MEKAHIGNASCLILIMFLYIIKIFPRVFTWGFNTPPPDDSAKTRLCVTYSRCSTIEVAKSKIIQPFIAFVEVTICKNVKIQMGR